MGNKKNNFGWLYFWIALFIVVVITLLYVYILKQPEFTIYKENCWNERYCGKLQSNMTINLSDKSNCSEPIRKCEKVEVDEIEFYCNFECKKLPKENNIDSCINFCLSSNIPKLSLEWLEENCECSKICPPEYNGLPPSECKAKYCYEYKCEDYTIIGGFEKNK